METPVVPFMILYEVNYQIHCLGTGPEDWIGAVARIIGLDDAAPVIKYVETNVRASEHEIDDVIYPIDAFRLIGITQICEIDGIIEELKSLMIPSE